MWKKFNELMKAGRLTRVITKTVITKTYPKPKKVKRKKK